MDNGALIKQGERNGGTNQQFIVEPLGNNLYRIIAKNSGKALDVSGVSSKGGAPIIQWDYNNGDNQKWIIQAVENGYYKVIAKNSGKALDVNGGSQNNGANIIQWDYWGGDNQLWKFESVNLKPISMPIVKNKRVIRLTIRNKILSPPQ